jgi:hypothetical protein
MGRIGSRCPTPNDRHAQAAAIHCGASVIVTVNLGDFLAPQLAFHDIEAQHPESRCG